MARDGGLCEVVGQGVSEVVGEGVSEVVGQGVSGIVGTCFVVGQDEVLVVCVVTTLVV